MYSPTILHCKVILKSRNEVCIAAEHVSTLTIATFMCAIQEQYIFIHDAILEAVTCGDTQVCAANLRRKVQKLSRRNPKTQLTGYERHFKVCMLSMNIILLWCISNT